MKRSLLLSLLLLASCSVEPVAEQPVEPEIPDYTVTLDEAKIELHYLRCNLGWYGGSDGYYLAGVFDTNASRPNLTRSIIDRYYRYNLVMTGGIRKK